MYTLERSAFKASNYLSIEKIASKLPMTLHKFTKTSYNWQRQKMHIKELILEYCGF